MNNVLSLRRRRVELLAAHPRTAVTTKNRIARALARPEQPPAQVD